MVMIITALVLLYVGLCWLVSRKWLWGIVFVPVMVSFAGVFALLYFDPGGFFYWFMD